MCWRRSIVSRRRAALVRRAGERVPLTPPMDWVPLTVPEVET